MDILSFHEDDFTIKLLYDIYEIIFTKKEAGNFSFQHKNISENITSNSRELFSKNYNINPLNIHNPILNHDKSYYLASKSLSIPYFNPQSQVGIGDAILVLSKNLYGMITFADCIPLALVNLKKEAIAAVHLGSRSIIKNVISSLINEWYRKYGFSAEDWFAIVGPSIFCQEYEIQKDFIQMIEKENKQALDYLNISDNKFYFDSRFGLKKQLEYLGVKKVFSLEINTYADSRFSSYRKDNPNHLTHGLFVTFH